MDYKKEINKLVEYNPDYIFDNQESLISLIEDSL